MAFSFKYQIIKSLVFALDTSADCLLLVFQSINVYMSCEYMCLSKEIKLCVRHKHRNYEQCRVVLVCM